MALVSGNQAIIGGDASVTVGDNLRMDAATPNKCKVENSADISYNKIG